MGPSAIDVVILTCHVCVRFVDGDVLEALKAMGPSAIDVVILTCHVCVLFVDGDV